MGRQARAYHARWQRVVVESRWTLDLKGQPGAVVEINTRSADRDLIQKDAQTAKRRDRKTGATAGKKIGEIRRPSGKDRQHRLRRRRDFLPAAIVWSLLLLRVERTEVIHESGRPVYLFCSSRLYWQLRSLRACDFPHLRGLTSLFAAPQSLSPSIL